MKEVIILSKIQVPMTTFTPPFLNHFSLSLNRKKCVVMKIYEHVHKYEAFSGCGVDILIAVTFLSIAVFQKQNQKTDLVQIIKRINCLSEIVLCS